MWKITASVTAVLASLVAAALLVGYSPVACGCIPAFDALLFHSGTSPITASTDRSAAAIESQLNRSLQGSQVQFGAFPYTEDDGCTQLRMDTIVCKIPIARSAALTRGMVVTYESAGGVFQRARVRNSYWP
jgi:hypothetical protein